MLGILLKTQKNIKKNLREFFALSKDSPNPR